MAVMDIKMIICELDPTLLRSDKTVSDYPLKTLNKCRLKGIKFGVAKARSNFGAGVFTNLMEPDVMI
jgi:hydroxymethylpyrimidine pyrophosphatase-like HAD family hydrolase